MEIITRGKYSAKKDMYMELLKSGVLDSLVILANSNGTVAEISLIIDRIDQQIHAISSTDYIRQSV